MDILLSFFLFQVLIPTVYGCIATVSPDDGITTGGTIISPFATTGDPSTTTTTAAATTTTITPVCPTAWIFNAVTNFCYLIASPLGNYDAKQDFCESMGGQLASVHSQAEMNFIMSLVPATLDVRVVLGYRRAGPGVNFVTLDGTPFDYNAFVFPQPFGPFDSNDCVSAAAMDVTNRIIAGVPYSYSRGSWWAQDCAVTNFYTACKQSRL